MRRFAVIGDRIITAFKADSCTTGGNLNCLRFRELKRAVSYPGLQSAQIFAIHPERIPHALRGLNLLLGKRLTNKRGYLLKRPGFPCFIEGIKSAAVQKPLSVRFCAKIEEHREHLRARHAGVDHFVVHTLMIFCCTVQRRVGFGQPLSRL